MAGSSYKGLFESEVLVVVILCRISNALTTKALAVPTYWPAFIAFNASLPISAVNSVASVSSWRKAYLHVRHPDLSLGAHFFRIAGAAFGRASFSVERGMLYFFFSTRLLSFFEANALRLFIADQAARKHK